MIDNSQPTMGCGFRYEIITIIIIIIIIVISDGSQSKMLFLFRGDGQTLVHADLLGSRLLLLWPSLLLLS